MRYRGITSCTATTSCRPSTTSSGIEAPLTVNGVPQIPIAGASFARTLTDRSAAGGKKTQYFEVMGSRAIYHDGWMASAFGPRVPWLPGLPPGIKEWTPDNDQWELYHLDEDWSQARDLAAEMPEKLAQMREVFAIEAAPKPGAPDRRWPVGARPPSRIADHTAVSGVGVLRRHHPHPRVRAPASGKQEQHRHDRGRPARRRQRRAVRPRRGGRRGHLLPRRRVPLLRVQPVSSSGAPRSARRTNCRPARRRSSWRPRMQSRGPRDRSTSSCESMGRSSRRARYRSARRCCSPANDCLDIGCCLGSPVALDYYDKAPFRFNGHIERVRVAYT